MKMKAIETATRFWKGTKILITGGNGAKFPDERRM
jgi:hypothetical protein